MTLSPAVSVRLVEHRRHVKGLGMLYGSLMRFQVLALALTALLVPQHIAVPLVWVILGVWGFANGLQTVTFQLLISKTIPAARRGRLMGSRNAVAGITLFLVSILGAYFLDRFGFPAGYGWTFLLSFALTSIGLLALSRLSEPPTENPRAPQPLHVRLRAVPGLLRSDPSYNRFVWAQLLATAARSALPFYILFIGQRFEVTGTHLAALTIVFSTAQSAGDLMWGTLADRSGYRSVFIFSVVGWMLGSLLVLAAPTLIMAYPVFVLVGAGLGGFQMSTQNLVLEFGDPQDQALRIATSSSLAEAVGLVGFVAAGAAADLLPLAWVFVASLVLHLSSILTMRGVTDPRTRRPDATGTKIA
jgi:MFS family permease